MAQRFSKEQRWEFRYAVKQVDGTEKIKVCYPRTEEKKEENKQKCKELGFRIVSIKKLYPFNTYANQHNFELIKNICFCEMDDMRIGEVKYDEAEYDRLEEMKDKAERFFCLELPVAWLPWEDWKEAKELSELAILHRQNCCIENGRPDLVAYC